MKTRLQKFLTSKLSAKLSLWVVFAMAILLMASLVAMLHYSRIVLKKEVIRKATQTLEATALCVDNILMNVEQTAGNVYFMIEPQLHNERKLHEYCRRLVEKNYYVQGCAIAMEPGFFPGQNRFMAYYRRKSTGMDAPTTPVIRLRTFGTTPYTEQNWYTRPMQTGRPGWMRPLDKEIPGEDPIVTYCLPLTDTNGRRVGVLGLDVSLSYLSHFVLETKPSQNSYCTLLDGDGSFLVHPDNRKLQERVNYAEKGQGVATAIRTAARAMRNGETGYKPFRMDGKNYYIFYKPFVRKAIMGRAPEELNWSAGIVYPEDDIFGDYNHLLYYVLGIAVVGLLLLYVLVKTVIHRQLLPLRLLTASAQRIARGNYNEKIPFSAQQDEIGRLQNHFQQMQESLAANVNELEEMKRTIEERGKELAAAYDRVQRADRMKTAFLHHMTNQMVQPALSIYHDVGILSSNSYLAIDEVKRLTDDIQTKSKTIADLLGNLLNAAENGTHEEERP